jgi:DNA-binding FadR family transcriptional regulator
MTLRSIPHRSLADQLFERVATEIVNGRYPPGTRLPPERALSLSFGVNRHVVREALQRMQQLGLVAVSRSSGATVLDIMEHGGLDVLVIMAEYARGGADVVKQWRSVLEMRATIAVDSVRLCALRGGTDVKQDLVSIAEEMDRTADERTLFALEVRFWGRVLDGAGNLAYRLAFNSLLKGVLALGSVAQAWSLDEIRRSGGRVQLARAILSGDAQQAEALTRGALRATSETFDSAPSFASSS